MADLGDALEKHKHSLRRLAVDTSAACWLEDIIDESDFIGSLADFASLTSITISAIFLVGCDVKESKDAVVPPLVTTLPCTLEDLEVIGMTETFPEYLFDLGKQCVGVLTKLKIVKCSKWDKTTHSDISRPHKPLLSAISWQNVSEAFESAGVEFAVYKHLELYDRHYGFFGVSDDDI